MLDHAVIEHEGEEIRLRIRLKRVFVLRIWLGAYLLRFSLWILGGRGEVLPLE